MNGYCRKSLEKLAVMLGYNRITLWRYATGRLEPRHVVLESLKRLLAKKVKMVGTKRKTPYDLEDRIKFGQFRDMLIKDIIKIDPKYIDWLWSVKECDFTEDVWEAVVERKKERPEDRPTA